MSKQTPLQPSAKPVEYMRLHPIAYAQLEKELPKVGSTSNPIEAGLLLGVQLVLQKLRAGFVVEQ